MIRCILKTTLFLIVVLCSPVVFGQSATTTTTNTTLLTVAWRSWATAKAGRGRSGQAAHISIKARDHEGTEASFEGVAVAEVLKLVGVKFGEQLRGKDLALFLVVEAADGYCAVFASPELDPAFTDRVILLADKRDGKALAEKEGPLRIVVADEKRQARWVRQVVALRIQRAG